MDVSLNWLNEFVDLSDCDVKQIAHELTVSGLEVEGIKILKPCFKKIITAKIIKIDQHPNADKLHLVTIDNGCELKTVVCGAQNIEEGQIIPYASEGSQVLSRKTGEMYTLTPTEIRGVLSQGMLCSADELGLSDRNYQQEDGILILNNFLKNPPLGQPLEDILGLDEDTILEVAPTANRGDQMSVIGIARELCALFNKNLKFSPLTSTNDLSTDEFDVKIIDNDVCKYYSVGILKNINIKPSPQWMQKRLIASGIRAINNVVDITNYVLLEYGTPLHAFDLDKLDSFLCVRHAKEGEKLITLDGVERNLSYDSVVIAKKDEPVCLAGVFGGQNSEVDENTKNIALEAAYFTPESNRKSSRSVGYHSDACARFERGIDIEAVKPALMRAMQLLTELADADVVGVVEDGDNKINRNKITLRFAQVEKILGCKIDNDRCISILEKLGFTVLGKNELAANFEVPSFRDNDVTREIDLIEEIARINGYDKITPTIPAKNETPFISKEEIILKELNNVLLSSGLNEIVTSSLIGEPLLKQFDFSYDKDNAVIVTLPKSEDYTMLRQNMLANILSCLKYNYDNGQKVYWTYEIGKTFLKVDQANEKSSGVKETRVLAGCITGEIENSKWQHCQKTDFYTLKGILEKTFEKLGISNRVVFNECSDVNALHPYRSAKVSLLGKNPIQIGYFGQLHPILKDKMKLKQDVFVFELNLEEILNATNINVVKYKKLPLYPEVQRDLSFIVPEDTSFESIKKLVKKAIKSNLYKGCEVFDVYQGEHLENGFKSIAFKIKLQDENATLTDDIVENQIQAVKDVLEKSGINLRK